MNRVSRRSALTAAALLAAPAVHAQPRSGGQIRVGALHNAPTNSMMRLIPEFETATGIRVVVEQLSAGDLLRKATVESVGRTGYYDVLRVAPNWIPTFAEPEWIAPLDARIRASGFDLADFIPSALEALGRMPGDNRLWALPQDANVALFAYRTDLFGDAGEQARFRERYGYALTPPRTTREWHDAAEFFNRGDMNGFGFAQKAPGPASIWAIIPLWTFGAEIVDEVRKRVVLNSPQAVAAFEWALRLQRFQPRGVLSWEQYDQFTPMAEGRLATSLQFFAVAADLLDPAKSRFHDRIAFTTIPAFPENGRGFRTGKAHYSGGSLALHAHSRNADAAWRFMSWVMGREQAPKFALAGTLTPRVSVLQNDTVLDSHPAFRKILPPFLASLADVAKPRPMIPESTALLNVIGNAWQEAVVGRLDARQAIEASHRDMAAIMRNAGYPQ
jgi:multiple sugar transport system substrate-binding protein